MNVRLTSKIAYREITENNTRTSQAEKIMNFVDTIRPVFQVMDDKVIVQHQIRVSRYLPTIIRNLLTDIHIYNVEDYIVCPNYCTGDFQIGITENCKINEDDLDTLLRGINEEVGLTTIKLKRFSRYVICGNKEWCGVVVNGENLSLNIIIFSWL